MTARLALVCVLAAGCHAGADRARAETPTAPVRPGEVVDRVVLTGVLHATNAAEVAVPAVDASDLTIRWMVEDGAIVKAGDRVLAFDDSLFTSDLQDRRTLLANSERQFRLLQHTSANRLALLRGAIRKQQIARDKAKLRADLPADLVTARTAQDNQRALAQAEIALRKARTDLEVAQQQLALEERVNRIALEKIRRGLEIAEGAIAALVVEAPRDGVVVIGERPEDRRKYHVGDTVQRGTVILSQPDLTKPVEVRADLCDVDDGRVDPRMAGTCTLDAYPADPIACTVEKIAPVARPAGSQTLRRAFDITLALAPTDPAHLRPGASVKIELGRPAVHGLVVARAAVLGGDRVRLGSGELRSVSLGACDAQRCVVAGGLAEGDAVAIGGAP